MWRLTIIFLLVLPAIGMDTDRRAQPGFAMVPVNLACIDEIAERYGALLECVGDPQASVRLFRVIGIGREPDQLSLSRLYLQLSAAQAQLAEIQIVQTARHELQHDDRVSHLLRSLQWIMNTVLGRLVTHANESVLRHEPVLRAGGMIRWDE